MKWIGRRNFVASGAMAIAGLPVCAPRVNAAVADAGSNAELRADRTERAAELIHDLKLEVLPKESGYIGIIGRSAIEVELEGMRLAAQSQNYYMLTRDRPINYLHWLASDDTHILIEGGPVDYYIFHRDGRAEMKTLGMGLSEEQRPVVAVPAGCWKALRLHPEAEYALTANALSPEFTPDRVRIGEGEEWVRRFERKAPWATAELLRQMIGPNWKS